MVVVQEADYVMLSEFFGAEFISFFWNLRPNWNTDGTHHGWMMSRVDFY